MDGNDTARKLAFCGALVAGIAYFGISIFRDAFKTTEDANKKTKSKRRNSDTIDSRPNQLISQYSKITHASSQTDLTLPIGTRERFAAFSHIPADMWAPWAKSIQERIRELNLRMVNNSANFIYNQSKTLNHNLNAISLQNSPRHSPRQSPRHSPRVTSPELTRKSHWSISRSAENLNNNLSDSNSKLYSSKSNIGITKILNMAVPSETEIAIHKRTLDKLFGQSNPNISQQEASSLAILLLCKDQDILVKSLSVLANCAAFSINIDPICDSGCLFVLSELLEHNSSAVQLSATQAIGNIAHGERAQELLKDCIPVLIENLIKSNNELHLNWTLVALGNLALKDANHHQMIHIIDKLYTLLSDSTPLIRNQTVKLLINLSCNSYMVPYLLAAKSPSNLFSLLDPKQDGEFLLRFCHFFANVIDVTCHRDIKPNDLPFQYKAASPETLYSAIFGFETSENLFRKLKILSENVNHDDTLFQIKRIIKRIR